MPFTCPRDGTELAVVRDRGKVCHQCPECHGYLVTVPLLRRLLSRAFVNELWNRARQPGATGPLPCPQCDARMASIETPARGESPAIELDLCTRCQHVWLDPGEIESAPRAESKPTEPKLSSPAREAIAKFELKSLEERRQLESDLDDDPEFDSWLWHIPHKRGVYVTESFRPESSRSHQLVRCRTGRTPQECRRSTSNDPARPRQF